MDSVIHLLNNWDLGSIFSRHGIKKISGFSANDSGFIAYSKISTLESGFKKLRIRMSDSPDACGRKPYQERITELRIQKYLDTCVRCASIHQSSFLCHFLSILLILHFV